MNRDAKMATARDIGPIGARTMRKVVWRLLPFLMICYLLALIDRTNVGMASLQMNRDIGMSDTAFGFGASLFFYAYFLTEVPSNLMLQKVGARVWIARIMISWGLVSACTSLVRGSSSFCVMRLILGAAEAGFFPGVVLYLTYWIPRDFRGRILATFAISIPGASLVGSPISGLFLNMNGLLGLRGWQWLFIAEGVPAALLGIACLFVLTDNPEDARWLADDERQWLLARVGPRTESPRRYLGASSLALIKSPGLWAMVLACSAASSAGSVLAVWQPQLIRSFGLSYFGTGLLNAMPYAVAVALMVIWGRHSDSSDERRWHTAAALLLMGIAAGMTLLTASLVMTVALLCAMLVGAYCFKGPFWSLASGWFSRSSAAVGIAVINAISNLVGGGVMVSVYGLLHERTHSYAAALAPVAGLSLLGAVAVLAVSGRQGMAAQSN